MRGQGPWDCAEGPKPCTREAQTKRLAVAATAENGGLPVKTGARHVRGQGPWDSLKDRNRARGRPKLSVSQRRQYQRRRGQVKTTRQNGETAAAASGGMVAQRRGRTKLRRTAERGAEQNRRANRSARSGKGGHVAHCWTRWCDWTGSAPGCASRVSRSAIDGRQVVASSQGTGPHTP